MKTSYFIVCTLVMAGVTYLIRMLPLALFRRKLESRFIRSFLYYIPYSVLGAMTFPAIFFSTSGVYSAAAGLVTAVLLSWRGKSLIIVAMSACAAVFIVEAAAGLLL